MTKTTNYQLNQWEKSDRIMMDDFNADNEKIDAALKSNADKAAAALAAAIEEKYPGLCRPIFFCSRSYNYACSDGALLLEFGTNGNTMEEAQYTAELIAPVIAEVISGRAE